MSTGMGVLKLHKGIGMRIRLCAFIVQVLDLKLGRLLVQGLRKTVLNIHLSRLQGLLGLLELLVKGLYDVLGAITEALHSLLKLSWHVNRESIGQFFRVGWVLARRD